VNESVEPYRTKALEALAGAQSELANQRFNNAASRAYYAAYDAAIVALIRAGFASRNNAWDHDEVQARFATELTRRRKLYPSELARVLYDLSKSRIGADYTLGSTSRGTASSAVQSALDFVSALLEYQT
jgi:uncharacterized protein (UPF0332 family)